MPKGMFISLEGPDGCGKTTQAQAVAAVLRSAGRDVLLTREPGGTALGEVVREMLLSFQHTGMCSRTEMLLYAASRAQHVEEVIMPHLQRGGVVICDRYIDSSLVYQGLGLGLPLEDVLAVNLVATQKLLPDLTILFSMSVASSTARLHAKQAETANGPDRIEARGSAYATKVAQGYAQLKGMFPCRIVEVDADRPPDAVTSDIIEAIRACERGA